MFTALQKMKTFRQQGNRRPVIHGMSNDQVIANLQWGLGKRDQITSAHQPLNLGRLAADIHDQFVPFDCFAWIETGQQVGWLNDNAGQVLFSMYNHALIGQQTVVQPTHCCEVDESFINRGYHQPDGIHVGCQHDLGAGFMT